MIDFGIDVPNELVCLPNSLYVDNLEIGEKVTKTGFVIPEEKMDARGEFVRPRWARVIFKSDDIKNIDVGDWVLISHGMWSSSILMLKDGTQKKIWFVSPKSMKKLGVIAKSKTVPEDIKGFELDI